MIKRQFYKQEHNNDKDDVSDSSSSSSDSDSEDEVSEAQEEEEQETDAVSEEAKEDDQRSSLSPGSGYKSEDSSANEVDYDSSGSLLNDDDGAKNSREILNDSRLTSKINIVESDADATKDSIPADFTDRILKCRSVFKCRLCPRIVCLSEETLRAHLVSKRHARSEKLLSEGRLKFMLNSDGEVEEDPETHAERHARTLAIAQKLTEDIKKKNKGRQRQSFRLKRKKTGDVPDKGKEKKQPVKNQAKKRRKTED